MSGNSVSHDFFSDQPDNPETPGVIIFLGVPFPERWSVEKPPPLFLTRKRAMHRYGRPAIYSHTLSASLVKKTFRFSGRKTSGPPLLNKRTLAFLSPPNSIARENPRRIRQKLTTQIDVVRSIAIVAEPKATINSETFVRFALRLDCTVETPNRIPGGGFA